MAFQINAWSRLVLISGVFLAASCGGNEEVEQVRTPVSEDVSITPDDARNLYILHCESCHGIDGKKKFADAADLSESRLSDAEVKKMILNGNDKGMMPYKDIITAEAERDALVGFVKSLRK